MKAPPPKANKRLLIQTGGFFNCPYEWVITDFVYWKSNTQDDRRWTCRMKPIQQYTPVKRIETITNVLDRLCERSLGFSKIPFGKPQRRRCGDGLTAKPVASYQYVFDAKVFDAWLKSQPTKPSIRKRIDPYPKADSQLSENGQDTYPKADTTIMNKEENKKNEKEEAVLFGEQPPKPAAVAPVPPVNLAEEFEKLLQEMEGNESMDSSAHPDDKAAEGGGPVGIPSMSVASPVPIIQFAYGNSNGGNTNLDDELEKFFQGDGTTTPEVTPIPFDAAEGSFTVGMPSTSVVPSSPSTIIQFAYGKSNDGGDVKMGLETFSDPTPIVQPSVNGTANTGAPGTDAGHSGTSAQRAEGTIAKSGGLRGNVPKAAVDHAEWVLRQLKKSSPYTVESIAIIERELWKGLSEFRWSQYPAWSDSRQEVNKLKAKLLTEFGQCK